MNGSPHDDAKELPNTSAHDNAGGLDGAWLYEQHRGGARQGWRVTAHLHGERSAFQKIDVYDTAFFGRVLVLDDLMMFTERDEFVYHEMLIHVPLCSMSAPRSVLVIGGGDGGCVREVLKHECVQRVVQCEIDERVTRVCEQWFGWLKDVQADPRVEMVFEDGMAYVERHAEAFDLIVVDSTDPVGPAEGLFRTGFYAKVARALTPNGVMVAQTESPHWDDDLVGNIFGQIRGAFTHVAPYVGFVPTYPSGMWSWAYASNGRGPHDVFDADRAAVISAACRYYQPDLQRAAFVLPRFAQQAVTGERPFRGWDRGESAAQ